MNLEAIKPLSVKHLISIADLCLEDVEKIYAVTHFLKANRSTAPKGLADKRLAMMFEKESLRTRVTFDVGMQDLGGSAVYLDYQEVRLGARESIKDVARNMSRWMHGIVARTYRHRTVQDLAKNAEIPVVNGLTDFLHPCQGLTDFFTMTEVLGSVKGRRFAYVGDGNNTCHSLIHAAALQGCHISVASPEGYEPNSRVVNQAMRMAQTSGSEIRIMDDPKDAVKDADCVYTDVWASMGQEDETEERAEIFSPFRVDTSLMSRAASEAIFLHCLPAHRGAEVTSEVIDAPSSKVYQNAENRLHIQKAILYLLMRD